MGLEYLIYALPFFRIYVYRKSFANMNFPFKLYVSTETVLNTLVIDIITSCKPERNVTKVQLQVLRKYLQPLMSTCVHSSFRPHFLPVSFITWNVTIKEQFFFKNGSKKICFCYTK